MGLIRFIGNKIEKLLEAVKIGALNKLAGGILLGGFYALLLSFGVYFMDRVSLISDELKASSFTYPYLEPLPEMSQGVGEKLKPLFTGFWDKMMETMDTIKETGETLEEG